jgi:hypothetical protein
VFTGVGVKLDILKTGHKYVRSIIKGSPAAESGLIRVGDRVLEINGTNLWDIDLKKCPELIAEAPLDDVWFKLSRKHQSDVFDLTTSPTTSPTTLNQLPIACNDSCNSDSDARPRSSSDVSVAATVADEASDDEEDGHCKGYRDFLVKLDITQVGNYAPELIENFIYTKGHGQFIRGRGKLQSFTEVHRWVAIRDGKLIVTKGQDSRITKILDIAHLKMTTTCVPGATRSDPREYVVSLKAPGKQVMHFAHQDREKTDRLVLAVREVQSCECSVEDLQPKGFCATRINVPEDLALEYGQLK